MDKFQYIIRRNEWASLTTQTARKQFIREMFYLLEEFTRYGMSGMPSRSVPEKESTLLLRTLRNCFHSFDRNLLPDYIPSTVFALIRN